MNGFVKAAIFATVVVGLVVVSLLIVAKFLITPDRVRETILPIAEKSFHRPVSIGDIDVRLFSGISIKDFNVSSKDGSTSLISADALNLTYRVWPLFFLQVVIDEAHLDGPEINAVRYENGEFNFSDLLASEKPANGRKSDERPTPEPAAGEPVIDVLINKFSITNGRLVFIDRNTAKNPLHHQLENLNVTATDISPGRAFPVSVESRINNAPLAIYGSIEPQAQWIDLRFQLEDFDVTGILPYFENRFPGTLASLHLDLNVSVKGDPNALNTSGQIEASRADLTLDALPDAPLKNAWASLDYDLSINTELEKISIHKANARLNGIPLSVNGMIKQFASKPNVDLYATLPMTPIASLLASFPEKLVESVSALDPEGQMAADVQLSGEPDNMETLVRRGQITFDAIRITSGGLPVRLNGRVDMEKDTVTAKGLEIRIADSPAVLDVTATEIMGKPVRISHTLIAQKLNLDEILPATGSSQKMPPPEQPPTGSESPPQPRPTGPIDLPVYVDGTIRVANAVYRGLDIRHFELLYLLENNILTVKEIRGEVAGGTLSGTGHADLNENLITYTADMSIEGTQTNAIVSALYPPAVDTLFGNLFLDFKMNGRGIDSESILQNITGNADMRITDGSLTGTGLTRGLASFLDADKLEVLSFNSVSGDVQLVKGKFRIVSEYAGSDLRMAPSGTIGLDGAIDLSLNLSVAPELAAKIDGNEIISRLLENQEGWAVIPLNVAGSLSAPRFSLDTSLVKQMLQKKAVNKLQEQIRKKLFDSDTPDQIPNSDKGATDGKAEPGTGNEKQPTVEQMLQERLRKLIR